MLVPEGFTAVDGDGGSAVVRADLAVVPLGAWWAEGAPLHGAKGRGGVRRASIGGCDAVLRTFRRGGLLRRALPDAFLSPARAVRELCALAALRARGVPVVEPLAALARRRGLGFELRLATRYVDGALPLPAFVAAHPQHRRAAVSEAGRVVACAFDAGLAHPDLHPDNVVAREGPRGVEVLLLDLDRARVAPSPASPGARDAMLVRMARYLLRHRDDLPVAPSATDRLRFLRGLGLDRAARRRALARLGPELSRQAARRNLDLPATPRAPST